MSENIENLTEEIKEVEKIFSDVGQAIRNKYQGQNLEIPTMKPSDFKQKIIDYPSQLPSEELITPYHYFKNILDNDTEDYTYKTMFVWSSAFVNGKKFFYVSNYDDTFLKIGNSEVITLTKSQVDLTEYYVEENIFKVWNNVYNCEEEFFYLIVYTNAKRTNYTDFTSSGYINNAWAYLIGNDNILRDYYSFGSNTTLHFTTLSRRTNFINGSYNNYYFNAMHSYELKNLDIVIDVPKACKIYFNYYGNSNLTNNVFGTVTIKTMNGGSVSISGINSPNFKRLICLDDKPMALTLPSSSINNSINHYTTDIINFDVFSNTSVSSSLYSVLNLVNLKLYNIKASLNVWLQPVVGSSSYNGYSTYLSGEKLTYDSIIHTIQQYLNIGSSLTLTIGPYNIKKIENTYVKLIEITNDMYYEDNNVYEKLPFEVCESTDEGAMLITEYASLKNLTIA